MSRWQKHFVVAIVPLIAAVFAHNPCAAANYIRYGYPDVRNSESWLAKCRDLIHQGQSRDAKLEKAKAQLLKDQQELFRCLCEFRQQVERLKQRFERSPKRKAQANAKSLSKVLQNLKAFMTKQRLEMMELQKDGRLRNLADVERTRRKVRSMTDDLRELMAPFLSPDDSRNKTQFTP